MVRTESIVAVGVERVQQRSLHPVHAILLAGTIPLFVGVLLSDVAYAMSYEVQWKNFSSWLIVGGLVVGGFALLSALAGLFRADRRARHPLIYFLLPLAAFALGVINALVHAKDAWASMPEALIFSAVVAALAIAATGLGFSNPRAGEPN